MKSKTTQLILISIGAFLALSAIQVYLVYNTYTLKKNAFIRQVKDEIYTIDDDMTLDSITDIGMEYLQNQLIHYKSGEISKREAIEKSRQKIDSLNQDYKAIYVDLLQQRKLDYALAYQKSLESIVLLEGKNDPIFPLDGERESRIFGEDFPMENAHLINVSRSLSQQEHSNTETGVEQSLTVEFKFRNYVRIIDEQSIIFKRMRGILIGSFLIFGIVIGLFYYSLRGLLRQKKISAIKTDFINNITHELKTPLTTLNIGTKSLRNKTILENPKALTGTLDTIDRQNHRLQQLIDQVIHKSVKAEDLPLKLKNVDLIPFLRQIINDFKVGQTEQNLQVISSFKEENLHASIDPFYFTTALLNILDNAVKYNEGEKIIRMEVSIKNSTVQIIVEDNGMGIPKKELPHLFDKFYRAKQGDVHSHKSLGLGLFYTHQIILAHHGSLQVKSKPGKGSVFFIQIPLTYV